MASEQTAPYITAFEARRNSKEGLAPAWLDDVREAGISAFSELGFPTVRQEAWKYTNVQPLVALPFRPAEATLAGVGEEDIFARLFLREAGPRIVFVNGMYAPKFSALDRVPDGVRFGNFSALGREGAGSLSHIGRVADIRRNGFVALNTAFLGEGAVVQVSPGVRVPEPIQIIHLSVARHDPVISHPRVLIVLGRGSEASIVENYAGVNGGAYLCNAVSEMICGDGAIAHHYRIQREGASGHHVGMMAAVVERDSNLTAHSITLSGGLVRNDVHLALRGEGARCALNGLYLAASKEHVDNFTEIEHVRPRASSSELYKGILDGAAHAVFNGKIVVHKDAQKTDARQTNRNLLLSPDAMVNTNPQLEIYADDVKCTHGSSIGQLDPDALFYLRSRGLDPAEARSLLRLAFASEIVSRLKIEPLRQGLHDYLAQKFAMSGT